MPEARTPRLCPFSLVVCLLGACGGSATGPAGGDGSGVSQAAGPISAPDEPEDAGPSLEWASSELARVELGKTEVTLGQFRRCVEAGACSMDSLELDGFFCDDANWLHGDREDHPMNCVSWYGAADFCRWVGGHLPTAKELQEEASGGGARRYPWGDGEPTCDHAVWGSESAPGEESCGRESTMPVCSKAAGASPSGLCDLVGNVWEWTSDVSDMSVGFAGVDSFDGDRYLAWGGSWRDRRDSLGARLSTVAMKCSDDVGFRCARSTAERSGAEHRDALAAGRGEKDRWAAWRAAREEEEKQRREAARAAARAAAEREQAQRSALDDERRERREEARARAEANAERVGVEWRWSAPAGVRFSRTEVTLGQFEACVTAGVCKRVHVVLAGKRRRCNWGRADRKDHPMNCVTAAGARQFCSWVGGRLPRMEEWNTEASNGGQRRLPWGDREPSCDLAVWQDDSGVGGCGRRSTWPVCEKAAGSSASGLCDLAGNVREWTATTGHVREYSDDIPTNAACGGSWDSDSWSSGPLRQRHLSRPLFNPGTPTGDCVLAPSKQGSDLIGFRCVLPAP